MTDPQLECFEACAAVAEKWADPDHPARSDAVRAALGDENVRATEEALAYALNHFAGQVEVEALSEWLGGRWREEEGTAGLWDDDPVPGDGLRSLLAVWGTGRAFVGCLGGEAKHLVPAFAREVQARVSSLSARVAGPGEPETLFEHADALFARPSPATVDHVEEKVRVGAENRGIPPARRHVRPPRYTVGAIDGNESDDQREGVAEDMLLHEGRGVRRLALLWAPEDLSPDPYLEAMATFRGVFPAHDDTPGTLQMQQAFLEAQDAPHAYAAGLEFLLSRGTPEVQKPAHVRWTEYDRLEEVSAWVTEHDDRVYAVVARPDVQGRIDVPVPVVAPGAVRRPPLDDPEGRALVDFLDGLETS
jgi:hypothetical protein